MIKASLVLVRNGIKKFRIRFVAIFFLLQMLNHKIINSPYDTIIVYSIFIPPSSLIHNFLLYLGHKT